MPDNNDIKNFDLLANYKEYTQTTGECGCVVRSILHLDNKKEVKTFHCSKHTTVPEVIETKDAGIECFKLALIDWIKTY